MRGCLLSLLLLILVAANGYAIWQLHLLRAEVRGLRAEGLQSQRLQADSMIEHAQGALEALKRGELARAQEELDRLADHIEQAQAIARRERRRLRERLEAAKEAVAQGSARAAELVDDLVGEVQRIAGRSGSAGRSPEEP